MLLLSTHTGPWYQAVSQRYMLHKGQGYGIVKNWASLGAARPGQSGPPRQLGATCAPHNSLLVPQGVEQDQGDGPNSHMSKRPESCQHSQKSQQGEEAFVSSPRLLPAPLDRTGLVK